MNDAERDAWLREALRHTPDSQALPPHEVSEAILAQARVAARSEHAVAARGERAAPTNPLASFWAWLGRPPVAAGFASVMAATLVGLMWWDRPIDETLPGRRDAGTEPAQANEARGATAPSPPKVPAGEQGAARDTKVAPSFSSDKSTTADALAHDRGALAERKRQAPTPFPAAESERAAPAAKPALAAKKDETSLPAASSDERAPSEARDARPSAAAEPAASPVPPPAAAGARMQLEATPPPRRRDDGDDARAPAATAANVDAAKSAPAPTTPPAPARPTADAPEAVRGLRSGALADRPEKQASAFGSTPAAPTAAPAAPLRSQVAAAQLGSIDAMAPPAPLLAILGANPARWSRQNADGAVVALDAAWRNWLGQLGDAATSRWSPSRAPTDAAPVEGERDAATTVRLFDASGRTAVVRLRARSVRVEAQGKDEHWVATLPAEVAERLRTAAAHLPP